MDQNSRSKMPGCAARSTRTPPKRSSISSYTWLRTATRRVGAWPAGGEAKQPAVVVEPYRQQQRAPWSVSRFAQHSRSARTWAGFQVERIVSLRPTTRDATCGLWSRASASCSRRTSALVAPGRRRRDLAGDRHVADRDPVLRHLPRRGRGRGPAAPPGAGVRGSVPARRTTAPMPAGYAGSVGHAPRRVSAPVDELCAAKITRSESGAAAGAAGAAGAVGRPWRPTVRDVRDIEFVAPTDHRRPVRADHRHPRRHRQHRTGVSGRSRSAGCVLTSHGGSWPRSRKGSHHMSHCILTILSKSPPIRRALSPGVATTSIRRWLSSSRVGVRRGRLIQPAARACWR